jgi:hypothetical protein
MDLIDKGIKARQGHRHRSLPAAALAHAQRPSRDSAVSAQRADPETAGPVAARSSASVRVTERARLREVAAPGWRRWVPQAALAWAAGYGLLRIWWALGAAPSPPPAGTDLVVFTGWWAVALCGAAAVVVIGLRRARWRRPLAAAAWGVTAALVAASALLLLDVVGILLPGAGQGVWGLRPGSCWPGRCCRWRWSTGGAGVPGVGAAAGRPGRAALAGAGPGAGPRRRHDSLLPG